MSFPGGGKNLVPESVKTCILYDSSDGHIVHTHQVITLPGGKKVEDREVESRAFEMAKKTGKEVSKLKALHVLHTDYSEDKNYKVDPKSQKLVEIPKPEPFKPRPKKRHT